MKISSRIVRFRKPSTALTFAGYSHASGAGWIKPKARSTLSCLKQGHGQATLRLTGPGWFRCAHTSQPDAHPARV
uniref:Uncharacterized protein n=1 Tax=Aquisalinus luteolus TaxID=1566827 RepID=A0A8J3A0V7_9PROT|nr:hypothetical protein GCM10011355_08680 [Aquisalinus luteolus]